MPAGATLSVLVQGRGPVSRSSEGNATRFALRVGARGVMASAGLAGSRQQLRYVLSGPGRPFPLDPPRPGR